MTSLRLRYEHWIPRRLAVRAIVLYPYVLFSDSRERVDALLLRHEIVHVRQVRRLGWWRFYSHYLWEYFRHRCSGMEGEAAYRKISFEQEAYALAPALEISEAEKKETGLA